MEAHQLINSSANQDWCTPPWVIAMARNVMGSIDLDPASSWEANAIVDAKDYFATFGLEQAWAVGQPGNVWCNPPYGKVGGKSGAGIWLTRMRKAYASKEIKQGMILLNASIGDAWFREVWHHPVVLLHKRLRFSRPDGTPGPSPTKGNALVYFGRRQEKFRRVMGMYGKVVMP
tara:strand:- start:650 stop:1171 length:522 start_codon:yes stop_codon:yes gene_type:complete